MFRIGRQFGLTTRGQANLKTAIEITSSFKEWSPKGSVRYDFSLTRLGIREDLNIEEALSKDLYV